MVTGLRQNVLISASIKTIIATWYFNATKDLQGLFWKITVRRHCSVIPSLIEGPGGSVGGRMIYLIFLPFLVWLVMITRSTMRMIIAHMDHYDAHDHCGYESLRCASPGNRSLLWSPEFNAHHQVIDRCYDHQNSMRIVTRMRIESLRIVVTMRNDLRNNTPEPVLS